MSRRAARFTEADVTRVLKAAKKAGMGARINLCSGVIDVSTALEAAPPTALDDTADSAEAAEAARLERMKGFYL